jgi:hypothetical protein
MITGSLGSIGDGFDAVTAGLGSSEAKLTGKELQDQMRNAVVWMARFRRETEL